MDPRESESFHAGAGVIGGHLEAEIDFLDDKIGQTDHDIDKLSTHAARLRMLKSETHTRYHAQDGIVIVDTVGNCLLHLTNSVALLEAKKECMEATVNMARAAQAALDKYGNKLLAIPKID